MKFKTILKDIVVKNSIKKSEFIASVKRVDSVKDVETFLYEIKKKYRDADHNPFAYRLIDGSEFYSDDGEPRGSSGIPIYNAIRSLELFNVCVVVTRYFGGIKLGIQGLIEAYSETALFALKNAGTTLIERSLIVQVEFPYSSISYVNYLVTKLQLEVVERVFDKGVKFTISIPEDKLSEFLDKLSKDKNILYNLL